MRIPSYRHHKPTNQAVVTISCRDFYLGRFDSKASRQGYDRLIAEYLASGRSITFGPPVTGLTIENLIADFAAFAKKQYGVDSSSEYLRMKSILSRLR